MRFPEFVLSAASSDLSTSDPSSAPTVVCDLSQPSMRIDMRMDLWGLDTWRYFSKKATKEHIDAVAYRVIKGLAA